LLARCLWVVVNADADVPVAEVVLSIADIAYSQIVSRDSLRRYAFGVRLDVTLQLGALVHWLRLRLLLLGLLAGGCARTPPRVEELERQLILFVLLNNELELLDKI